MKPRILIVDDDIQALRMVGMMLERQGYEIAVATSGEKALQKVSQNAPDLIIMDVMMPQLDGFEVTRRLKANPDTLQIPVLLFTAKNTIVDKVTGFQCGADDYLTKPIYRRELLDCVEELLQQQCSTDVSRGPSGRVIGFLPAQGGVGNTTLTLNAAIALSQLEPEKKIIIVELSRRRETLALQMNLDSCPALQKLLDYNLANLTLDVIEPELQQHFSGVYCLLSASPRETAQLQLLTPEFVTQLLHELRHGYDYILLDLASLLDDVNVVALHQADFIAMTLEAGRIGRQLAGEMLDGFEELDVERRKVGLINIQRAPTTTAPLARDILEQSLNYKALSTIPSAPELAYESVETGMPMVLMQPQGLIAQQVRQVVDAILNLI